MKVYPYQKPAGCFALLCLLALIVVLSVSLFITHTEQPALLGVVLIVCTIILGGTMLGFLRLQADRKQGKMNRWYQQPELTGSLGIVCMILVFIFIGIFIGFTQASTPKFVSYLELIPLVGLAFLCSFFFILSVKYRKREEHDQSSGR